MRRRQRPEDEAEINITPMLDIVFIMLIFFIVTTSFVREQGLDISRPQQADNPPPQQEDTGQIVVRIDQLSQITVNDRPVDDRAVRANLERERASKPKAPLIVASHPDADTNSLVLVLDAANIVGIDNISVATTK
ncbi:biopolymer transporter ExbD [Wenzhouxiangella sp. XN79A]|uniref:ExbD/TolR family protein n=1 Tax=Wenzhouxiangella sp. XN79A TaxID=2724193 RepID=UPI00144ADF9A|nr:biopolymer transporter ExbD [Wenzhouxiangella sp. XN79A]NKI35263.1 biopolymer transporter ExbD [Wenzhouxiangella sp. XN79A]